MTELIFFNNPNNSYDKIVFNTCNNVTTLDIELHFYDETVNRITTTFDNHIKSCNNGIANVKPDTMYHIFLATEEYQPDEIVKIDITCICEYSCSPHQQISCGDSVMHYGYQFSSEITSFNNGQSDGKDRYHLNNITFMYDETVDYIQFDTCNNVTTLDVGIFIFDHRYNRIEYVYPTHDCSTLTTSLLEANKLYHIGIESNYYRGTQVFKLDVSCHCDCNYFIPKMNMVYDNIQISDTIDLEFNVKFSSICQSLGYCNILHLGSEYISLPKLSVDSSNNFVIQFSNNHKHDNIFYINKSIDIDDIYHHIRLSINNHKLLFMYDNITQFNLSSSDFFYHSNYQINNEYELYVSSPWDSSINGTVDRVHFRSYASEVYTVKGSENFILVTKLLTWNNALLFCKNQFNASLAVIYDNNDWKSIINLRNNITDAIQYSRFWVGVTDQGIDRGKKWFGCNDNSEGTWYVFCFTNKRFQSHVLK